MACSTTQEDKADGISGVVLVVGDGGVGVVISLHNAIDKNNHLLFHRTSCVTNTGQNKTRC